ncbi:MAG: glycoside hydrolase family 2 protein, partial [Ignavibacteriaceae bacterium]
VNWIPADLFLPRVTKEEYQKLILLAKKSNCNMIRVWGGGVYEQDYFYELCDEHGILVWQDFMFACGSYPEHDEFIENINKEIHQVVERLQHHPSIALWCGNNENEWIWYQTQREPIETMSGFKIFHNIIPNIVKESDPERSYWPSSPFGYDEDPNDQQSGNTHQWDIWSNWIDYSEVTKDNSFFVSEFGFQGPANINTLEKCLSPEHRKIQDEKFEFHNKQVEGPERVLKFLAGHLPISTNWQDFIYLSQLNQGLALKRCIEHWRANRPRTNGSIIWQLNDCWPVVSWSLVDSSYLPKMAYYFVKRAFAPAVLLFKLKNSSLKIYGLNQGLSSLKGYIKLVIINLSSAEILYEITKKAILIENSYKSAINIPKAYQKNIDEYIYIVTFYSEKDELIIRNFYITKEWKYIETPKPNIEIKKGQSKKKNEINITTDKPAFFVDLYHPELSFSERGFFILPEEKITLDII